MFFGKDSGLRAKEPPNNMLWAMGLAAGACILIGVIPGLLYQYLPYAVDYHSYTLQHVTSTFGMLGFTALGFFLLLKQLDPKPTISLDTDWFDRRGSAGLVQLAEGRNLEPDRVSGEPQFGWTGGGIILGGAGSDLMQGEAGDDIIDGDVSLKVAIRTPDPAVRTGPLGQALRAAKAVANSAVSRADLDAAAAAAFAEAKAATEAAVVAATAAATAAADAEAALELAQAGLSTITITDAIGNLITAAVLGGDGLSLVLRGVSGDDSKHVAERLVETTCEAYIIQGQEIECAASIGIALMPTHGEELWHLISVADQAMYNAKDFGQGDAANDRAAYVEAAIASK